MAYCTNCGKSVRDDARFCPNCGAVCGSANPAPDGTMNPDLEAPEEAGAKVLAAVAYVHWILIIVAAVAMPKSKLCRFHANQALVLFLAELIVSVVAVAVYLVFFVVFFLQMETPISEGNFPFTAVGSLSIGALCLWVFAFAISITSLVFTILGIVYAAQGKRKALPLIGRFHILK